MSFRVLGRDYRSSQGMYACLSMVYKRWRFAGHEIVVAMVLDTD